MSHDMLCCGLLGSPTTPKARFTDSNVPFSKELYFSLFGHWFQNATRSLPTDQMYLIDSIYLIVFVYGHIKLDLVMNDNVAT